MVCMRVAFHESDRNHKNGENDEENYKQGVLETTEMTKPRESGVQTTGSETTGLAILDFWTSRKQPQK